MNLECAIKSWLADELGCGSDMVRLVEKRDNVLSTTFLFETQGRHAKIFVKHFGEAYAGLYAKEARGVLSANGVGEIGGVRVPKPIARNDGLRCIAIEYVKGQSLYNWMRNNIICVLFFGKSMLISNMLYDLGKWTRQCHDIGMHCGLMDGAVSDRRGIIGHYIDKASRQYEALYYNGVINLHSANDFKSWLNRVASSLGDDEYGFCFTHGDLCLSNCMVTPDESLVVIDFANSGLGHWLDDVMRLKIELEVCSSLIVGFGKGCARLIRSFEEGYGVSDRMQQHMHDDLLSFFLVRNILINLSSLVSFAGKQNFVGRGDSIFLRKAYKKIMDTLLRRAL